MQRRHAPKNGKAFTVLQTQFHSFKRNFVTMVQEKDLCVCGGEQRHSLNTRVVVRHHGPAFQLSHHRCKLRKLGIRSSRTIGRELHGPYAIGCCSVSSCLIGGQALSSHLGSVTGTGHSRLATSPGCAPAWWQWTGNTPSLEAVQAGLFCVSGLVTAI